MGGGGVMMMEDGKMRRRSKEYAAGKERERLQTEMDAERAANASATRTPTLSDQAVRDAILAERARLLTGNSRKQAFRVGARTPTLSEQAASDWAKKRKNSIFGG
jgi:hypothetical protein